MHAAESTHFYTRDGKPCYTVTAKAGHQRPTTVADARKLKLCPSVTTIIKCAAAPGLEVWKQNQVLMAALTLPRMPDETEQEWLNRVMVDSRETARKAADKGTAIHAQIQGFYETGYCDREYYEHVGSATTAVEAWLNEVVWVPERSFSHESGFGGKADLSCGRGVLDFKTKEFASAAELRTWDEHALQLAAYRVGLGVETARCAIVYVSVNNPGLSRLIEIPEEELKRGWEMFKALLSYWIAKNKYNPAYEKCQSQVA